MLSTSGYSVSTIIELGLVIGKDMKKYINKSEETYSMGSELLSDLMSRFRSLEYNHTRGGWPMMNSEYDGQIYISDSIISESKKQEGRWVVIRVSDGSVSLRYHRSGYVGPPDRIKSFEVDEVTVDCIVEKVEEFSEDRYSVF